jgi:hypothetical protein
MVDPRAAKAKRKRSFPASALPYAYLDTHPKRLPRRRRFQLFRSRFEALTLTAIPKAVATNPDPLTEN